MAPFLWPVLFGGQTWLYDGKDWTEKRNAGGPEDRSYPGMCFDPVFNRVLLAGKGKDGRLPHLMWAFDGEVWSSVEMEGITARPSSKLLYYHATYKKLFFLSGTVFAADLK